jgi:AcrR family transcriptional regulator
MRVTAQVQAATREKILAVASDLFAAQGFDATTTRDIARAAGIATGTMFNYFSSKEAIVGSLAAAALADLRADLGPRNGEGASFEEDLFAFVAAGLRKLKPLRKHLPAILGTTLSPVGIKADEESCTLRVSHLEEVVALAHRHGLGELSAVAMQIYWSLYTGLLLFWASDTSPRQEDTLALLDHSLEMFASWLSSKPKPLNG